MSDPFAEHGVPRGPLLGAAALVGVAIVAVLAVQATGVGRLTDAPDRILAERTLHFEDGPAGSVAVIDARTGAPVDTLEPGADGFIRATLRALVRERRMKGLGAETPFHLSRQADGRLLLLDPATGRQIDLHAFGPTNAAAFDRLLAAGPPR